MRGVQWRIAGPLIVQAILPLVAGAQEAAFTVSGDPQTLVVWSAEPGSQPDPVWDEGTTYSLVTGELSSIEVQLDAPLPPGLTLRMRLEPPPGARGSDLVELETAPRVLVSSIPAGTYVGLGIQYHLTATLAAGVVPLDTRRVTFTLTASP